MTQNSGLLIIYGIVIILIIFFLPQILNSVKNIPGLSSNTPLSGVKAGINDIGMYDDPQLPKFGKADFWPEKGTGFKPNKFGSTGASPTGGMRPHFDIPVETDVGWWAAAPEYIKNVPLDIYDNSSNNTGNEYVSPVGWWNA